MKRRVISIYIFLLLVCVSFSLAASVENVGFYTNSGDMVSTIGPATVVANFKFDVQTTSLSQLKVDLSQINTDSADIILNEQRTELYDNNGYYKTDISFTNQGLCIPNTVNGEIQSYSCTLSELRLKPGQESIVVNFKVWSDTYEEFDQTLTFQLDTQQPTATEFYTEYCTDQGCFIPRNHPTKIGVQVQDNGPLVPSNIYFRVGSNFPQPFLVCEGGTCETPMYVFTGSCSSEGLVTARLSPQSTDAVGNYFEDNIFENLICDESRPGQESLPGESVGTHIYYSEPPYPYLDHKATDDVVISILVTEDNPGLTATANFSTLVGNDGFVPGDCNLISGNVYNCSWDVNNIVAGTHELEFMFYDVAGRQSFPFTDVFSVDEFDAVSESGDLNFFQDISAVPNSPNGYSRLAIEVALKNGIDSYPIWAVFRPLPTSQGANAEIFRTETNEANCYRKIGNNISPSIPGKIRIPYPYYDYEEGTGRNQISIEFTNGVLDSLEPHFEFICEIELTVRKNGVVYDEPAVFNLTIPIHLKDAGLDAVGSRYVQKIKDKEDYINGGLFTTVEDVGEVLQFAGDICSVVGKVATAAGVVTSSETVATACGLAGPQSAVCEAISEALGKVTKILTTYLDPIINIDGQRETDSASGGTDVINQGLDIIGNFGGSWMNFDEDDGIMDKVCKIATCSAATREGDDQTIDLFGSDGGGISESNSWGQNIAAGYSEDLMQGVGQPDPKDSIIASVQAECLPGILYHIEKYREMECAQLACYKRMAQLGLDITTCDQLKAQAVCQAVIGEAFSIGPLYTISQFTDNVNSVIQNSLPSVIKNVIGGLGCNLLGEAKENSQSMWVKLPFMVACELPKAIGTISYQFSDAPSQQGTFYYPEMNGCDFALCNAENMDDCPGTVPINIQQARQQVFNPYQKSDDVFSASASEVIGVMEEFDDSENIPENPNQRQKEIMQAYAGVDVTSSTVELETISTAAKETKDMISLVSDKNVLVYARDGEPYFDWSSYQSDNFDRSYGQYAVDLQNAQENLEEIVGNDIGLINDLSQAESYEVVDNTIFIPNGDGTLTGYTFDSDVNMNRLTNRLESYKDAQQTLESVEADMNSFIATTANSYQNGGISAVYDRLQAQYLSTLPIDTTELQNEIDQIYAEYYDEILDGVDLSELSEEEFEDLLAEAEDNAAVEVLSAQIEDFENRLEQEEFEREFRRQQAAYNMEKSIERQTQAAVSLASNYGVRFAFQQGWLDWMQWDDQLGFGHVLDGIDNALDSEKRKHLICNQVINTVSDNYDTGAVVQCTSESYCTPVLSFAAQRIKVSPDTEDTQYLYTASWFIGNVQDNSFTSDEPVTRFNVVLKSSSLPTVDLHTQDDWALLPYGAVDDSQVSFVLDGEYKEICFRFSQPFPPEGSTTTGAGFARREYCRDIAVAERETGFDTGEPQVDLAGNQLSSNTYNGGFTLGVGGD